MKLLALDCSNQLGTVAIMDESGIIHTSECRQTARHARVMLPMLEQLLLDNGWELSDCESIVCCQGPGSFTGVRIGMSIVKGLAFSLNLPLIPVSSLDAIACRALQLHGLEKTLISVIDARMNEIYWSHCAVNAAGVDSLSEERVGSVDELRDYLANLAVKPAGIAGVGLSEHSGLQALSLPLFEVEVHAQSLLQLALSAKSVDASTVEPVYIRNQVVQS